MFVNNGSSYSAITEDNRVLLFNVLRAVTSTMYSVIFVLGVGGNSAACYILSCRPKHTATTLFLINLSVADLMMALFCVPVTLISDCLLFRWIFGTIMCRVFPFIQGLSVFLAALTHVAISLDRYFVVFHPLRRQGFPLSGAIVSICFVWVFSVVVSSPMLVVAGIKNASDGSFYCQEAWGTERYGLIYSFVAMVFQYFLPLSVIVSSYSAIAVRMWFYHQPGESIRARDEAIVISKRKMIKMFILVAVFYSLSQLPRHLIFLANLNHLKSSFWDEHTIWIMNFTHLLSLSACFYNPLLYIWLNAAFRRKFRYLFQCKSQTTPSGTGERAFTFQDNPMILRRVVSVSCNNVVVSTKSVDRRM